MSAPGVARKKTLQGKPTSFPWSVFFQCFNTVFGTSWSIPTGRQEVRRDGPFIETDDQYQEFIQQVAHVSLLNAVKVELFFLVSRRTQQAHLPVQ